MVLGICGGVDVGLLECVVVMRCVLGELRWVCFCEGVGLVGGIGLVVGD